MINEIINKPKINKWIGRVYVISTILVAILFVIIAITTEIFLAPIKFQLFYFGIMTSVLLLLIITTCSLFKTKYIIRDGTLYSWSPFAVIKLKLKDIRKIKRMLVPFHIRVGASLYSGRFYIPTLGWTKAIITNLSDGVLIMSRDKKYYLITPSNPDRFVKLLKNKKLAC